MFFHRTLLQIHDLNIWGYFLTIRNQGSEHWSEMNSVSRRAIQRVDLTKSPTKDSQDSVVIDSAYHIGSTPLDLDH